MRLVLDTNVLAAAFIAHGTCNELLEHCVMNHDIVLSAFILDELRRTLTAKFRFTDRESEDVVKLLESRCILVKTRKLPAPISRDPDDDNIIATALCGDCSCIVTGDKDLLDLKTAGDILIVSPGDFWKVDSQERSKE
jgi:putative PIN family toxin of toxin-antitoxin system